jgi:hypothetical protein
MEQMTRRARIAIVLLFVGTAIVGAACVSPAPVGKRWLAKGCYPPIATSTYSDVYFNGAPNVLNNATQYSSKNGTCTDRIEAVITIVRADSIVHAGTVCEGLGFSGGVGFAALTWQTFPVDAYTCT